MQYWSLYSTILAHASRYAMRRGAGLCIILGIFIFLGNEVKAAVITNLSDKTQIIEQESFDGFLPVSIKPYETYRVPGQIKLHYAGRETTIGFDEEYAIWGDGNLGPQKLDRHTNGVR
jgi:hypothetical protein